MAQVWNIKTPTGEIVRPGEWTSAPIWSVVEAQATGNPTLKLYSYGIGGDVPGSPGPRVSNLNDTNMQGSGAILPENEEFLIYSLHLSLYTRGVEAVQTLQNLFADSPDVELINVLLAQQDVLVTMSIANTKEYSREKLGYYAAAVGVNRTMGAARTTLNATVPELIGNNGGVSVWDGREFATPHHVAPGEAYEVAIRFPNGGAITGLKLGSDSDARLIFRCYTEGYHKRPVA